MIRYNHLDEANIRLGVHENPQDFIQNSKQPVIIDKIQYAPGLLT